MSGMSWRKDCDESVFVSGFVYILFYDGSVVYDEPTNYDG